MSDSRPPQKCLFISTTKDNEVERQAVAGSLAAQGIETVFHEWESMEHFQETFQYEPAFDLLYLSAHADANGFGEDPWENPWDKFADTVCATDCMLPDATLFLACCRGGLKTVALNMLSVCNKIDYIVGPVWRAKGVEITKAFHTFCDCCYTRKDGTREAPCNLREKMSEAAGQDFACYDRVDMECDLEVFRRLRSIDVQVYQNFNLLCAINGQNEKIMAALGMKFVKGRWYLAGEDPPV